MKKLFRVAVLWLCAVAVFPLGAWAQESPHDARLRELLQKKEASATSEDARPPSDDSTVVSSGSISDIAADIAAEPVYEEFQGEFEDPFLAPFGENAIDLLIKDLRQKAEKDSFLDSLRQGLEEAGEGTPPYDVTPWGLEGNWFTVIEKSGPVVSSEDSHIRLLALRRADGFFDRALALEITHPGETAFLILLAEDVKGFESEIDLVNFRAVGSYEILLTVRGVKSASERVERALIIDARENNGRNILYDSATTRIPSILGRFFNNWRAEIIVEETNAHTLIDLSSRKAAYRRKRVYNDNSGRLRTPLKLWISPHGEMEISDRDRDGIHELRKVSELYGAGRDDLIAWVDSTMRYQDGKWQLIDCWIAPAHDLNLMPIPIRLNRPNS